MIRVYPSGKRVGRPPGAAWHRADLTGMKFHRITVVSAAPDWTGSKGDIQARWNCVCECGKKKRILGQHLKRGMIKSCGCLSAKNAGDRARTHGQSHATGAYSSWQAMKTRCTNERQASAPNYVLRGIKICARWFNSFEKFFADMGPRPRGMSIERIDNDGNYEPGNCRWARKVEQANNSRQNRIIKHNGIALTVAQWSRKLGLDRQLIYNRLHRGINGAERILFVGRLPNKPKQKA